MTFDRRQFIQRAGMASAALTAGGYIATPRGYAKNETLQVGVIGTGGRAMRRLMPALHEIPGVQMVAVCDVYKPHLKAGHFVASGKEKREVATFVDYHELLARDDIDAVMIASPDHWHVPMAIDAVKAGKDVYVEKPVTHKLEEGEAIIKAVRESKQVLQVGTQQRSMPQFHRAKELIAAGRLGPIRRVKMSWNRNATPFSKPDLKQRPEDIDWKRFLGNAPDQPYDPYRQRSWRWFWDFGNGILTDLMVHWLDSVVWLCDLKMPHRAMSVGDHFAAKGIWETPDTIQALLHYKTPAGENLQLHFEGSFVNASGRAGVEIQGEQASIYLDRGRYEYIPEGHRGGEAEEKIYGEGPRGADFFDNPPGEILHLSNWLESIRTRKDPSSPIEHAVYAAGGAHMGNQAYRTGKIIEG